MKSFDVLIVGAGIVGCACARECAQAGLRVGLIEGNVPGGGATAAGMGHVVVMDDSPAQLALTHYSRSLWQQLIPHLPTSVEYESRGTLWVAADDEERAEVHAKRITYAAAGIRAHVLDAAQVAAEEPKLRPGLAGGLLVPDDAVIYPPAAAGWLLEQALELGAVFLRGSAAISASQGEVRLADGTTLHSRCIVLAIGADCALLPTLPIKRRKGHLLITDRYPDFLHHQLVELGYLKSAHKLEGDSVAFNVQPRRTGQLLIGSSRQYGNEDPRTDSHLLRQMLERAQDYMPELAQLSGLRVWTGFRAATPDKLPLIGPADGLSHDRTDSTLWLAAGFEGLGITNAPAAARLLADQILGRASAIDTAPYSRSVWSHRSSFMPESLTVFVNGVAIPMETGTVVSAALLKASAPCRQSVTGEPRTALCGMGICFECRAIVDGTPHRRTCQLICRDGMVVETQP